MKLRELFESYDDGYADDGDESQDLSEAKRVIAATSEAIKNPGVLWRGVNSAENHATAVYRLGDGFKLLYFGGRTTERKSLTGNSMLLRMSKTDPRWKKEGIPDRSMSTFTSLSAGGAKEFGTLGMVLPLNSVKRFAWTTKDFNYLHVPDTKMSYYDAGGAVKDLILLLKKLSKHARHFSHDGTFTDELLMQDDSAKKPSKSQIVSDIYDIPFMKLTKKDDFVKALDISPDIFSADYDRQKTDLTWDAESLRNVDTLYAAFKESLGGKHAALFKRVIEMGSHVYLKTLIIRMDQIVRKHPKLSDALHDMLDPKNMGIQIGSYADVAKNVPSKSDSGFENAEIWFEGPYLMLMGSSDPKMLINTAKEMLHV
jgi:hypothetical protein